MKKNIWIWNHYATNMYRDKAGRHFWFAKNLIKHGYKPTIFSASTIHNSKDSINTNNEKYICETVENIPFVFVNTPGYMGNGKKRINNMLAFYRNLYPVAKRYAEINGKPDAILASSVHPLTLVAGIKIAKKFNIPCICEIRDLWPETIVAYDSLKKDSLLTKILYSGEKWIYKRADKIIFTMEGGKDYIKEKGWDIESGGPINVNKVYHINNGVDLDEFNYNKDNNTLHDIDLNNENCFKVIYAGSIRKANNVKKIVEVAEFIDKKGYENIKFLIYGDGTEKEELEKYSYNRNLNNIKFKGFVEKNKIPYILSKSNLNILHFEQNTIKRYGASLNKMFEYFASSKPILSDCEFGYDLIKKHKCGVVLDNADVEQFANAIVEFSKMTKSEYDAYCKNANQVAKEYDFKVLTEKLIDIIEDC
ncbi:glycosyltransferase family 4 protein [Metabacillus halosaccharovorans]|uniref:glycosyltransferase family 4 protein n=1 Tax=Metabacillus halosaccharovorans TaxID=930124 RepID=UPI000994CE00|nr:glycosyltransferase family 4 protein [Metabacillus halosaccharovorans]